MSVERPTFFEGQVLSAADLERAVGYGRDARGRHLRYQHSWGIVTGLELTGEERTTADGSDTYVAVTLSPGLAVDGHGREVVVADESELSEALFIQLNVLKAGDPTAYYPVFLTAADEEAEAPTALAGSCAEAAPTRVGEGFELAFGRSGDELDLDTQEEAAVEDGPGEGGWRILLGYVQWKDAIGRFGAVTDSVEGIGRRYAGVWAGEVEGLGGSLLLRSAPGSEQGEAALALAAGDEGGLTFGPQDSAGRVTPVLTVDTDGNLTVTGKITGALAGGVQVESGTASDGMLLPLPPGITQEQVDAGSVAVQVQVTPRFQQPPSLPAPPAGERWLGTPIECRAAGRRAFCRFHWRLTDDSDARDLPGLCDYLLLAFPAE